MKKIHVGFLLSYDYEKLKQSIPPVYKAADKIFIAEDSNKKTWSGNSFSVDSSFYDWIKTFDVDKKIVFYRDNFYVPELTGIQMDTRERYMLSLQMGIGNWLIQVDSDEFFLDFETFVKQLRTYDYLLENPKENRVQIAGFHIDIYKYLDEGLLYVKNSCKVLLATNYPNYKYARQTKERIIYVNSFTLHESLARSEEDLTYKINNWSHREDINPEFLDKWKRANKENYREIEDVFYMNPTSNWKKLGYIPTKDCTEMKAYFDQDNELKMSNIYLFFKNFGQWFKYKGLFRKKTKPDFENYIIK